MVFLDDKASTFPGAGIETAKLPRVERVFPIRIDIPKNQPPRSGSPPISSVVESLTAPVQLYHAT